MSEVSEEFKPGLGGCVRRGGSVKRSLAMVLSRWERAVAKAFDRDAATHQLTGRQWPWLFTQPLGSAGHPFGGFPEILRLASRRLRGQVRLLGFAALVGVVAGLGGIVFYLAMRVVENDLLALPVVYDLKQRALLGMVRRHEIAGACVRGVHAPASTD